MVLGLLSLGKGLTGLLQGGGFGIGYGFGVRLGYDTYGGLKDLIMGKAQKARYAKDNFTSHLGSGIMSALNLKIPEAQAASSSPYSQDAIRQRQIDAANAERLQAIKEKFPERYNNPPSLWY